MKKILCLILLCCLLTGCYDYQELNNRAIITGISIDYQNHEYLTNFEIMSTQKNSSEENSESKAYYVTGSNSTLAESFQNATLSLSKDATYSHLKVVLLSKEVAENHMHEVLDYLVRDPEIHNIFYPLIVEGSLAEAALKCTTKENPVTSVAIQNMLDNNKSSETVNVKVNFETVYNDILDPHKDAYLNVVTIKDNKITLDGIALLKNENLVTILGANESSTFHVLNNNSEDYFIKTACQDDPSKFIILNLYHNKKTKIKITKEDINITSLLEGNIIEDNCNYDFSKPNTYEKVANTFLEITKGNFNNVMTILSHTKSDALGLEDIYYKKTKNELTNWDTLPINYHLAIIINKNGLIFEVKTHE